MTTITVMIMSRLSFTICALLICVNIICCVGDNSNCGKVHITVSSLENSYLELNWITDCDTPDNAPEYILLSSTNLTNGIDDPDVLLQIEFSDYPTGYYRTNMSFGEPSLPGNWEYDENATKADAGPHCFPYWISSVKENLILDSKCFAIQPTWMSDNSESIGSLSIGSMLIPGTHNSGSFKGVISILKDYVLCQDRSIWTQLVFGIRYFDFRIAHYNDGFFINHNLIKLTEAIPIFREIKKFVELAPQEIIFMDFHRFPVPTNFTDSLHENFTNILYEELGAYALPRTDLESGKGPSLNDIWAKNKNLVISYANEATVNGHDWLWHPLTQYWGDTNNATVLKSYLEKTISNHGSTTNPMWALMAELTPQVSDIIFRLNTLRQLADDVNRNLTKWIRDEWGSQEVNIVATDFFLGNDIINVAIDKNLRKSS